ncbi:single-stranded DNA-binding protein [Hathewaya histolytica]|uniref:Single-stranded DNA-binding protein n=1 Tax=Hathewaya histolytica TaxID=1498 RepID=A0A4U9RVK8_HATHI|nr:single-stranded DNA-binding protein [Hathewaya histolytica]VTQ93090.1 single-stranded DNA-binding protein [Hathewaya histolytica]
MDNLMNNNNIYLEGTVITDLEFSHEMYGEGFYSFYIEVSRLSEAKDKVNITISERLLTGFDIKIGRDIIVEGQLRSYNKYVDGANRLILTVFARDVYECTEKSKNPNQIFLNGFICKKPIYRRTPFGREISDMLLAVNRPYNKSDYIPTIAWGRNSRYCKVLEVGDNIRIWGRLQSREYQKKIGEDVIQKMAYEVSISKMEIIDKDVELDDEDENTNDVKDVEEKDAI